MWTRESLPCAAALLIVAVSASLTAQSPLPTPAKRATPSDRAGSEFAGEWQSLRETGGIVSVTIAEQGNGWTVQAFGNCTPRPCPWGTVPFTILESRPRGLAPMGLATFRIRSSTRIMTFRLGEGALVIETYNLFSGPGDQPSYFSIDELGRGPRSPAKPQTGSSR